MLIILKKFLLLCLYHLTFGSHTKGDLVKVYKAVRQMVRKWLRLPKDCPNSAIHAQTKFGRLGVDSLEQITITLKDNHLRQLLYGAEDDKAITGSETFDDLSLPMICHLHPVEDLLRRDDTRGYERVPAANDL